MITIDKRQIQLQSRAANKEEAIRQVGQLLVDSENIEAGYIASMLGREEVANTYLGNGISIPHGLPKDRDLIKQTGIAVVQVPAGVTWNPAKPHISSWASLPSPTNTLRSCDDSHVCWATRSKWPA